MNNKNNCNKIFRKTFQNKEGNNTLHIAIKHGSLKSITSLLEASAILNIQDEEGNTPLHCIFISKQNYFRRSTSIIKTLLCKGHHVKVQNVRGEMTLHLFKDWCIEDPQCKWENDLRSLLSHGVASSLQDKMGRTWLIRAVQKQLCPIDVDCILRNNMFVNLRDNQGNSALHHAMLARYCMKTLRALIRAGADCNLQNKEGKTALHIATEYGPLYSVMTLLLAGADVNIQDGKGNTPLHSVFLLKQKVLYQLSVLNYLLDEGADFKVQNIRGETPVHLLIDMCACYSKSWQVWNVLPLLTHEVDTTLRDDQGETCLIRAVRGNLYLRDIMHILSIDTNINLSDNEGNSALHHAALSLSEDILETLVKAGADCNLQNKEGKTALHIAAELGTLNSVLALLLAGAHVNIQDGKGSTPLHCVFLSEQHSSNHLSILGALLIKAADVNVQNTRGETPAHLFIDWCDYNLEREKWDGVFKWLVGCQFNINLQDGKGETCLIRAVQKKFHPVGVNYILSRKACVNLTDNEGNSALHHAAMLTVDERRTLSSYMLESNVQQDIMKTLIKPGANSKLQNKGGKTAASLYVKHLYRTANIVELFKITEAGVACYMKNRTDTVLHEHNNNYWWKLAEFEENNLWLKFVARSSEELGRMNKMKIGCIFSRYKDPVFVSDTDLEELVFSSDLMDDFPIYGLLINITYDRAQRRNSLMDVISYNLYFSPNSALPPELNRLILSHLSDKDLSNLFKAMGLKKGLYIS